MPSSGLTDADLERLAEVGISADEAARQLGLLRRPAHYSDVVRPATVGDGILRLGGDDFPRLEAAHARAAGAGRFTKFVPASGAASRMFRDLLYFERGAGITATWDDVRRAAADGRREALALVEFFDNLDRLPLRAALEGALAARGAGPATSPGSQRFRAVLDALVGPAGLGYDRMPKGLLPFHTYPDGVRMPFDEHLVEAASYARGDDGVCRLHLTVSPEHRPGFERRFAEVADALGARLGARFDVSYSVQKPSTDTLAVDGPGCPLRDAQGCLRLRPGGHGALIENLGELGGDLVFVKNIDNVQPDRLKPEALAWKRRLAGLLVELEGEVGKHLRRLREADPSAEAVERATGFLRDRLAVEVADHADPPTPQARRACVIRRLSRPLRVCGVVPNTGEPGGGPFWVRGAGGAAALQIVETAQFDPDDAGQKAILHASTHFNPVDLVCALRDASGEPFDLAGFVDTDAAIVTTKSEDGRDVRVLERPGLWNGAMAGWNTVFVELPLATFTPVKTVLDLLRPEHQ